MEIVSVMPLCAPSKTAAASAPPFPPIHAQTMETKMIPLNIQLITISIPPMVYDMPGQKKDDWLKWIIGRAFLKII